MRLTTLALAGSLAVSSGIAEAGSRGASQRARATAAQPTHLSPVTSRGRLQGFRASPTRPRLREQVRDAARVTFGRKPPAARLPEKTLWIPGHTLGWRSLRPAMKHFLSNPENGAVAAVFVAKEGVFRANNPRGRVLGDAEVRQTRLVTIQFSNPRAGQAVKAPEIARAVRELGRLHGAGSRLPLQVVTHSAADTHFRAALLDHIDPAADGVRFSRVVAVGPVFAGTWTGNLGATPVGDAVGMRQAASELAEGSAFLGRLERARASIDRKIEGPRVDLAFEGAPTLRLRGKPRIGRGDGFVQSRDVRRPGARTLILRGLDPTPANHLGQIMYPGSIMAIEGVLTGNGP